MLNQFPSDVNDVNDDLFCSKHKFNNCYRHCDIGTRYQQWYQLIPGGGIGASLVISMSKVHYAWADLHLCQGRGAVLYRKTADWPVSWSELLHEEWYQPEEEVRHSVLLHPNWLDPVWGGNGGEDAGSGEQVDQDSHRRYLLFYIRTGSGLARPIQGLSNREELSASIHFMKGNELWNVERLTNPLSSFPPSPSLSHTHIHCLFLFCSPPHPLTLHLSLLSLTLSLFSPPPPILSLSISLQPAEVTSSRHSGIKTETCSWAFLVHQPPFFTDRTTLTAADLQQAAMHYGQFV